MACCIPLRVLLAILGFYSCALVYTSRSGMSVAIVAMTTVEDDSTAFEEDGTHECARHTTYHESHRPLVVMDTPLDHRSTTNRTTATRTAIASTLQEKQPEFDWDAKLKGTILGSQYYLYIIMPTVAGRLTDLMGAKWVVFVGTVGPCILSVITPEATRAGGSGVLIAIRTLLGGFHGCIYAALFSLFVKWFPVRERVNANAGLILGGTLGSGFMYLLGGWLCKTGPGWPLVFYVNSVLYVPWIVLWLYFCTNDPVDSRHVSQAELKYILTHNPASPTKKRAVPWSSICTSWVVMSSLVSKMMAGFGYFLLSTEMPSFLAAVFGTPIFTNGVINCAMMLCHGLAGLSAAPLSNWIIRSTGVRIVWVRKAFQALATIGPAICLGLIPAMQCNFAPVVALLIASLLLYGFYTGGEWTIVSEYAPNSAGAVFGFTNILCFAQGVIAPLIEGTLVDAPGKTPREQWNILFYICVGTYLLGIVVFCIFGTDQQQQWDKLVEDCASDGTESTDSNRTERADSYRRKSSQAVL